MELIAACSERSATHEMSYAEPISHLFETAVDIAVQGIYTVYMHIYEIVSMYVIVRERERMSLRCMCSGDF